MDFEKIISGIFPTGRAWLPRPLKVLSAIVGGIGDEIKKWYDFMLLVKDSIFPELMDESFIPDWETRFRLPYQAGLTIAERRERLATQWTNSGGQTQEYIQGKLRESGFDVYVISGIQYVEFQSILGDELVLGDFYLEGNIAGYAYAIDPCEQYVAAGAILGDFVLGDNFVLDVNRPRIIQNHINAIYENEDACPIAPFRHKFVFYISGDPIDITALASIPSARYNEFRELVLRYKPMRTWAFAFLNLI